MLLRETKPKAKKKYYCDVFVWVDNSGIYNELTDEEKKQVDDCGGSIKIGEKYIHQVQVNDGDFYIFRANVAMNEICEKYDLYEYI